MRVFCDNAGEDRPQMIAVRAPASRWPSAATRSSATWIACVRTPWHTDDMDENVPVEHAAASTGIPARTLRYWIAHGKLPAVAASRCKLVRLADVRHLADLTGRPLSNGERSSATAVATSPAPALPPSLLAASDAVVFARIRDEWVQPPGRADRLSGGVYRAAGGARRPSGGPRKRGRAGRSAASGEGVGSRSPARARGAVPVTYTAGGAVSPPVYSRSYRLFDPPERTYVQAASRSTRGW